MLSARARRREEKARKHLMTAPRRQVTRLDPPMPSGVQAPYTSPTKMVDPTTGLVVPRNAAEHEDILAISLKEQNFGPHWPIWIAGSILLPILAAICMVGLLVFGSSGFISSSSKGFLLHLEQGDSKNTSSAVHSDLWLGLSGFCIQPRDGEKACDISSLNTFYEKAYNQVSLGSLLPTMPSNFGSQASSLLASIIFLFTSVIFQIWALLELRKAERDEFAKRKRWVHEMIVAKRLEIFFLIFAFGALVCGLSATTTLAASISATCASVNALGPLLDDSEFGKCTQGNVTVVLLVAWLSASLACLLQLGVIAFDGLSRKLRFEYEQLFHDLEAFANDDFVQLQNKLNQMHSKAEQIHAASAAYQDFRRKELEDYVVLEDVQSVLRRQEQLVYAQRMEFEHLWSQTRPPVYAAPVADTQQVYVQQQPTYAVPAQTPYYSAAPITSATSAYALRAQMGMQYV